jgi:hypothetical protein
MAHCRSFSARTTSCRPSRVALCPDLPTVNAHPQEVSNTPFEIFPSNTTQQRVIRLAAVHFRHVQPYLLFPSCHSSVGCGYLKCEGGGTEEEYTSCKSKGDTDLEGEDSSEF